MPRTEYTPATVDNRVPVFVIQRYDTPSYSFVLGHQVPAAPDLYLVECVSSDLPCQHIIHASRITLEVTA